jgi:putative ABC transport system permease protein
VFEQTKLPQTHASLNDLVTLELPSGDTRQLPLVGVVKDQSLGAGTGGTGGFFNATARGYVTQNTLEWLGQPQSKQLNRVHLVVEGDGTDTAFIEEVSTRVTDELEKNGVSVYGSSVRSSIGHPNEDLVKAMTGVLLVLGLLVVFLSGFLITNTLQALLDQQVQQVGIMKSVGARRIQIVYIYMVLILVYGLLAFVISIPLSTFGTARLLNFLAGQLNFSSGGVRLVPGVVILQVILALVVPQVAAFLPIWKGTGISVQEALSGIRQGGAGPARRKNIGLARMRRFSRPVRIAFQNVFRRPGRLALTLITLTSGGAIFIGTFSVKVSMERSIEQVGRYFLADVNLTLNDPTAPRKSSSAAGGSGIRHTEAWPALAARFSWRMGRWAKMFKCWHPQRTAHWSCRS